MRSRGVWDRLDVREADEGGLTRQRKLGETQKIGGALTIPESKGGTLSRSIQGLLRLIDRGARVFRSNSKQC